MNANFLRGRYVIKNNARRRKTSLQGFKVLVINRYKFMILSRILTNLQYFCKNFANFGNLRQIWKEKYLQMYKPQKKFLPIFLIKILDFQLWYLSNVIADDKIRTFQ